MTATALFWAVIFSAMIFLGLYLLFGKVEAMNDDVAKQKEQPKKKWIVETNKDGQHEVVEAYSLSVDHGALTFWDEGIKRSFAPGSWLGVYMKED